LIKETVPFLDVPVVSPIHGLQKHPAFLIIIPVLLIRPEGLLGTEFKERV
jgi:branched-subunit amino acid ABC-type transport system permease component